MFAGDPNLPRLGGMFFNPAYLMVNHDKNEFSIVPAQTLSAQPDIIGIDTANECVGWMNGTVLLSTSSTPEQNSSSPDSDSSTTGTIAGISIAAVAGVIFIVVATFIFWRRRRGSSLEASGRRSANQALVAGKSVVEVFEASAGAQVHEAGFDMRESAAELDGRTRLTELH